jgi:hypothetical protein
VAPVKLVEHASCHLCLRSVPAATDQDGAELKEGVCCLYNLSAFCFCWLLACYLPAYNAVLNVVPQRDGHSIALLDTSLLQASRQAIALQIEMMICQSLALVSGYDSARRMSLRACDAAMHCRDERTRDGHRAGPRFCRNGLPPCTRAEAAFRA